jgi:hypothetical protein
LLVCALVCVCVCVCECVGVCVRLTRPKIESIFLFCTGPHRRGRLTPVPNFIQLVRTRECQWAWWAP